MEAWKIFVSAVTYSGNAKSGKVPHFFFFASVKIYYKVFLFVFFTNEMTELAGTYPAGLFCVCGQG